MMKIYILVVVMGLVGGVVYGGYYYYKDTQERIGILTENNAKMVVAKQAQDNTINTLIADREKFDNVNLVPDCSVGDTSGNVTHFANDNDLPFYICE